MTTAACRSAAPWRHNRPRAAQREPRQARARGSRADERAVLIAKTLSSYLARQVLVWCGGVFAVMLTITFLLDYLELIRRGAARPEATLGLLLEMAALKLPHMAQEVLPFGILFGTMLARSEEHTSELQSPDHLVCRLLLEKKKQVYVHNSG